MSRVLIVNGNSSQTVTDRLVRLARLASPNTDFVPVTPDGAPRYCSTPQDVLVSAPAVVGAIAAGARDTAPDACLIACFGEPGLFAARARFAFPVIGMAQGAVMQALQIGPRYAVLTLGEHWPTMLPPLFDSYGLGDGCVAIERVDGQPLDLAADPETAGRLVESAATRIAQQFAPDSIIVGGAALTGLAAGIAAGTRLPPLIDCLQASIAQVEAALSFRRMQNAGKAEAAGTPASPAPTADTSVTASPSGRCRQDP